MVEMAVSERENSDVAGLQGHAFCLGFEMLTLRTVAFLEAFTCIDNDGPVGTFDDASAHRARPRWSR
jgi:hypothetical protein